MFLSRHFLNDILSFFSHQAGFTLGNVVGMYLAQNYDVSDVFLASYEPVKLINMYIIGAIHLTLLRPPPDNLTTSDKMQQETLVWSTDVANITSHHSRWCKHMGGKIDHYHCLGSAGLFSIDWTASSWVSSVGWLVLFALSRFPTLPRKSTPLKKTWRPRRSPPSEPCGTMSQARTDGLEKETIYFWVVVQQVCIQVKGFTFVYFQMCMRI